MAKEVKEIRAQNLFYDMVHRLLILVGGLLIVIFVVQIKKLEYAGEMMKRTGAKALMHETTVIDQQTGEEVVRKTTDWFIPDADYQWNYALRDPETKNLRRLAALFTYLYEDTGWAKDVVNDLACWWFGLSTIVVAILIIRRILLHKVKKLVETQRKDEARLLFIDGFEQLYGDRLVEYLIVAALVIALPVKHPFIWGAIAAIYIVVREMFYYARLLVTTNGTNPRFAKNRIARIIGWKGWGQFGNDSDDQTQSPFARLLGKTAFSVFFVVTRPFTFIWEKVKGLFQKGSSEFSRRHPSEEDDSDEQEVEEGENFS